MADPWSSSEPRTAPTVPGPASQPPADPWAGASYEPVSPLATPTAAVPPAPARRRWFVPLAVVTAVLAVVVFTTVVFWPFGRGADAPLPFRPITEIGRVTFEGEGARPSLTFLTGDQLYAAAEVGENLEVVAADLATGAVRWRTVVAGEVGHGWVWLLANPTVVLAYADPYPAAMAGTLVALDVAGGAELWRRDLYHEDVILLRESTLTVHASHERRLVGLDLTTGDEVWEVTRTSDDAFHDGADVHGVQVAADLAEPSDPRGGPTVRHGTAVVVVAPDRSARLVEFATGEETWRRGNVASPADFVYVYENWLYVADGAAGYRLLAYDLTDAEAQPRTLYTVEDVTRNPVTSPQRCGEERLCLLDRVGRAEETTEVLAIDIGDEPRLAWRAPAPRARHLVAVGDLVIVNGGTRPLVAYDRTGAEVFDRTAGRGVRLNAGNALLLGDELSPFFADLSLLGYAVAERQLVALDTARGVNGTGCSWRVVDGVGYVVCPTGEAVVIWRITEA